MTENVVSAERYRPEGADALVRLRHAYKVYRVGDMGVVALAGVDLDVMPGEFLAVVGPSGAGKSTILNLVGGLDRASAGIVEVEGRDLGLLEDQSSPSTAPNASASSGKVRHATSCRTSRCGRTSGCPPPCAGRRWRRSTTSTGCSSWSGSTTGRSTPGHALRRRAATGGDRGGAVEHALDPAGRRADGGTGFRVRGSGPRRVPRREPRVPRHDHHGHPRPRGRPARRPPDPGARRARPARRGAGRPRCPRTVVCGCPTRRSPRSAGSTSKPRSPPTRCDCGEGVRPAMPEPALVEGIDVVRRYPGAQGVIAVRCLRRGPAAGLRGADGTERLGQDDVPGSARGPRSPR